MPKPTRATQAQPKKIKTQAPVAPKVEKKKTPEKLKVEQKRAPEKKPEVKVAKKKPQIAIPEPQEITVAKKVERKIIPEKKVPEVQKRKAEKPKKPSVTSEALARVEALGFNLVQYLHSIGGTESRHHYKATNEEK
jgi:outer membrane biosynthesis protein TonB